VFFAVEPRAYAATLRGTASTFLKALDISETTKQILQSEILNKAGRAFRVTETASGVFSFYALPVLKDDEPEVAAMLEAACLDVVTAHARKNLALSLGSANVDRRRYDDSEALGGALDSYYVSKGMSGIQSASDVSDGWAMALVWATGETSSLFKKSQISYGDINEKYCELLYRTAKNEFDAGQYGEALVIFKKIHDLKWSNIGLYLDTSECFIKVNDKADAQKLLAELLSTLRGEMGSEDFIRAGRLFRAAGDKVSALSSFQEARKLYRDGK
jgi:tetratricopeptide (TPR) repeat protein